ncbi:MAG: hypothetical protein R3C16_10080 [Hyphomonadaceae bacterium]
MTAGIVGAALGLSGCRARKACCATRLRSRACWPGFGALGAVIAFAFGLPRSRRRMAIAFTLAAAVLIVTLGCRARPASLVLIGVGLSSFAGGLIALALNLAPNPGALADLVN